MNVIITVDDLGSLGRLTKPFLYESPLLPMQAEIAAAAEDCGLYSDSKLARLLLMARVNRRGSNEALRPSGVVPNSTWKLDEKERAYSADFDFNLSELAGRDKKREGSLFLEDALVLLRRLSVQAAAQVAIELGVVPSKAQEFLARFPDVSASLRPPRRSKGRSDSRGAPLKMVDVQILHDGGAPSVVLERRAAIRELLEDVLTKAKLGGFDGSSSGEFHFEFGFLVSDVDAAIDLMRAALVESGIPASRIGFEVTGTQE